MQEVDRKVSLMLSLYLLFFLFDGYSNYENYTFKCLNMKTKQK